MIALAIILALFASPAFARPLDPGGSIDIYLNAIVYARGRHVIEGDCMSACTMWLGYRWTCVRPDAELWFHAGSIPVATETMFAMYPPRVKRLVWPFMLSHHLVGVPGWQLIRLGVPRC